MNRTFNELLEQKIRLYKYEFDNASEIFITPDGLRKEESKTPYFHNGEFGGFREAITRRFLKLITPQRFGIGDGFLLTNDAEGLSKQCDVVIFDKNNTPLIENDYNQKFYSIESVVSVGEVKSTLTKEQLLATLQNLELAKKLRTATNPIWSSKDIKTFTINKASINDNGAAYSVVVQNAGSFNPGSPYDQIFTFLICKDFADSLPQQKVLDIISDFQAKGNGLGINAILSLKDGLLCYHTGEKDVRNPQFAWYPFLHGNSLRPLFIESTTDRTEHIKAFCSFAFDALSSTTIYHTQMNYYFSFDLDRSKVKNMPM